MSRGSGLQTEIEVGRWYKEGGDEEMKRKREGIVLKERERRRRSKRGGLRRGARTMPFLVYAFGEAMGGDWRDIGMCSNISCLHG